MLQETDRRFGAVTVLVGEKTGKYPDGNSLLIEGATRRALIDPSLSVARRAAQLGAVDLVVLSHVHEDHVAGLSRFPSARVVAPRADLPGLRDVDGLLAIYGVDDDAARQVTMRQWLIEQFHYAPRPDATAYEDGSVFDLGGGVRIVAAHLPGHTRGHSALLVEPAGVLFLGDIDLTGFGPYYGDAWSNLADFERSLQRVRDIAARVWVSFHHAGVIEERSVFDAKLQRFAARIGEREAALLAYLEAPRSLAQLVAHRFLYPPHATLSWIDAAERRTILQHLERLAAARRVVECAPATWVRA
jgi:glyoxylase-like metal-dependent hydrolase (beta-lactamase superfamily II)